MTDQTNDQSAGKPAETTPNPETNQVSDLSGFQALQEQLTKHSELLKKLAEAPDSVNAEGLKHLAEQSKSMSSSVLQLGEYVKTTTSSLEEKVSVIMEDYRAQKFQVEKAKVVKQYDLSDEAAALLDKVPVEEMPEFAEQLSKAVGNKFPAKLGAAPTSDIKVPPHLQGLADSLLKK